MVLQRDKQTQDVNNGHSSHTFHVIASICGILDLSTWKGGEEQLKQGENPIP